MAVVDTPLRERPPASGGRIALLQRLWLAALFVIGVGYAVLVPPFQTIDEAWHWQRVWSVVQGHYNCKQMPNAAEAFVGVAYRFDFGKHQGPVSWDVFHDMYRFKGESGGFSIATAACKYPPTGYLPAALVIRTITEGAPRDLHWHKMFYAYYGARLGNWLFFFGCVLAAWKLGRFRWPPLVFASIPMIVQQGMAINNDAVQLGALLLASALLTRLPTRASVWGAIALIGVASTIKPINAIAATLVFIALWVAVTQHGLKRIEAYATAAAAVLLPVGLWLLWNATMHLPALGDVSPVPVANVSREAQLALMRAEPMKFLYVLGWQLKQLFTAPPIDGGWRGVLLALGWYKSAAPDYVYALAVPALAVGIALLPAGARGRFSELPVPRLLVAASVASFFPYFAVIVILLYLEFTSVGSTIVFGVQGRYYLYFLCMLFFLIPMAARRAWGGDALERRAGCAFLALSLATHVAALIAIRYHFWEL